MISFGLIRELVSTAEDPHSEHRILSVQHGIPFAWEKGLTLKALAPAAVSIPAAELEGVPRDAVFRLSKEDCPIETTPNGIKIMVPAGVSLRLLKSIDVVVLTPEHEPAPFEMITIADFDY